MNWTIELLNKINTIDFVVTILNEKRNSLTNIYSPLSIKIGITISKIEQLNEKSKHFEKLVIGRDSELINLEKENQQLRRQLKTTANRYEKGITILTAEIDRLKDKLRSNKIALKK